MKLTKWFVTTVALAVGTSVLLAQAEKPAEATQTEEKPRYGDLHVETNVGSFKSIEGQGTLRVSFTGTLLVTHLRDGEMKVLSGKLRKEYDKNGRAVYTGTADVEITGKWRGVQWFGTNMKCDWNGHGFMRVSGEFDKDMKTGRYWYGNKPENWMPLPSTTLQSLPVPQANAGADPTIKPKARQGGIGG
ncbi:hypothetical protein QPK87_07105 [Kamptonema cortianum]|nr:hypothetical protein [Geitlerinema splendidum]MDK3156342.1 hypothetical protein [Kamptonema cortianum]